MKKNKILSFSEYRIKNALFIQKHLSELKYIDKPYMLIFASLYFDYLFICGISKKELANELEYLCNSRYKSYDENILNNIVDIMDNITNEAYLNKKYNL